jgi:hypothetical protein
VGVTRIEGDELARVREDFKRLRHEPSVFDDPEWRERDIERWDAHPWRLDKVTREGRGRGGEDRGGRGDGKAPEPRPRRRA